MQAARTAIPLFLAALISYLLAPRGVGAGTVRQLDELDAWAIWKNGGARNGGYPTWAYEFLWVGGHDPVRVGVTAFLVVRGGPHPRAIVGLGRLSPLDAAGLGENRAALAERPLAAFDLLEWRPAECELVTLLTRADGPDAADAPVRAEANICGTRLEVADTLSAGIRQRVVLEDSIGP